MDCDFRVYLVARIPYSHEAVGHRFLEILDSELVRLAPHIMIPTLTGTTGHLRHTGAARQCGTSRKQADGFSQSNIKRPYPEARVFYQFLETLRILYGD